MKTLTISNQLSDVIGIVERFGPEENEYSIINNVINKIVQDEEIINFRNLISPILNENTMLGHGLMKPFGYAGDFLLIEKIYQQCVAQDQKYLKWDNYYHSLSAAKAVRNRKDYFINILHNLSVKKCGTLEILILGSGPATDVFEFLSMNPKADIKFYLLDIDQKAIDFASKKNMKFLDKINFIRMNILRFSPGQKYDLIWSAGLFDYLNDRIFTGLLNRFKNNVKKEGEMIIGNFSPINPTKKVMEVICEWYLIHRSSQHLTQLAINAGLSEDCIEVDKEPLGINLFLRIKPNTNPAKLHSLILNKQELHLA